MDLDIEAWKRRLEGGVPEEWCSGVQCDVCGRECSLIHVLVEYGTLCPLMK
jgi:hypothetical protein